MNSKFFNAFRKIRYLALLMFLNRFMGWITHLLKQKTSGLSYKYPYSIIVERCSSLVGESYVSRISLVLFSRVIATILLLLCLGTGNVWGSVETLTSTEITSKSSSTALAYNTITQWTDTNVVYVLNAFQNGKSYPWVQIKKPEIKNSVMQAAFIRMRVPTDNKIDSIILVATTATNSKNGVTDIAKHTKFSSNQKVTLYLEKDTIGNGTNPASNTSKHITSVNQSAIRDSVHFALKLDTVTTDYDSLWLVTTAATRIWEIKVYYSAVQNCTSLGTINGSVSLSNNGVMVFGAMVLGVMVLGGDGFWERCHIAPKNSNRYITI